MAAPKALPTEDREFLLALRREFHRFPELSWEEHRTGARVAEELRKMGLSPQTGVAKTGVVVDIGQEAGPTVVLRADMDALPIQEQTDLPFASEVPGTMHACGHDAHTACLLTVARRLSAEPPPHGRVRLLFQPAEEGAGGADVMIEEGAFTGIDPLGVYGIHFWSQLPTGTIGVVPGAMMGSVDHLKIVVHGRSGHAAEPQDSADALVAAAYLITQLQTLVTRRLSPLQPVVLSIGQFQAGTAFNVIADKAELIGTIRTLDMEAWAKIPAFLDEIVNAAVAVHGCSATVELVRAQQPLVNDAAATAHVQDVAASLVDASQILPFRTLAGEDFSAFLERWPGCFAFIGAGGHTNAAEQPPHHNPRFILDEDAFDLGVLLLEEAARRQLDAVVGTE